MLIGRVRDATRVLGQSQGYRGLPVRDEVEKFVLNGEERYAATMVTAWTPTPDELERLAAGAPVLLVLQGTTHPPVRVDVGEVPEP